MGKNYKVLGLMSGSSLDGLDLAFCKFDFTGGLQKLTWEIIAADTLAFTPMWVSRLQHLPQQDALSFAKTHTYFGHYLAELALQFLYKHQLQPDFISSHGHTIFHYPDKRLTVQIGDGAAIAALTGLPVITDFRTQDVAINGEGTPLAPLADRLLFPGFDFYLNLGGIANISAKIGDKHIAFDVGPANQVLNALAQAGLNMPFDKDGEAARQGSLQKKLLVQLDKMEYFTRDYPKSLDNNWIREKILPLYFNHDCSWQDRLATATEHLALKLAEAFRQVIKKETFKEKSYKLYITGGGAFNNFLIERINFHCQPFGIQIVVPVEKIVQFKEAILMALMGVLRMEKIPNCLSSVTGAKRNTIGGAVYWGNK